MRKCVTIGVSIRYFFDKSFLYEKRQEQAKHNKYGTVIFQTFFSIFTI